jgi:hypothetical protein
MSVKVMHVDNLLQAVNMHAQECTSQRFSARNVARLSAYVSDEVVSRALLLYPAAHDDALEMQPCPKLL